MKTQRLEVVVFAVLVLLLAALGAVYGAPAKRHDDVRLSSYTDGARGLHAFHLLLAECGAHPVRVITAPGAGDPADRTLFLGAPSEPVTRRETQAILDWVLSGGRLVVVAAAPGMGGAAPNHAAILAAAGLDVEGMTVRPDDQTRFHVPSYREGLHRIEWNAAWQLRSVKTADAAAGKAQTLLSSADRALVVSVPYGDHGGEITALADARLIDNESLARADNAVLAVRLVLARDADQGRVVFDEFHQGYRAEGTAGSLVESLADMLVATWPGRALLVAAFAGLVFAAGAAVRFGAADGEKPPPRRALSEHAEALGHIFETAGARAESLRILAAGARRAIGSRTGIPTALPPAEFAKRLAGSPAPGAADLADAIRRADAPHVSKDSEMATVAANLAAAKRRFLHGE